MQIGLELDQLMNPRRKDGRTGSDFITESKECIFSIWRTPPTIGRAGNTRRHDETRGRETRGRAGVDARGRCRCRRCTTHCSNSHSTVARPATVRLAASRSVACKDEIQPRQKEQKPEGTQSACHIIVTRVVRICG